MDKLEITLDLLAPEIKTIYTRGKGNPETVRIRGIIPSENLKETLKKIEGFLDSNQ